VEWCSRAALDAEVEGAVHQVQLDEHQVAARHKRPRVGRALTARLDGGSCRWRGRTAPERAPSGVWEALLV